MIAAIMGVCGCGKTTVGTRLADRLGWRFFDADDFHPPENVSKMASGIALTDDDRWPWLDRLAAALDDSTRAGVHVVLACSALKQAYRERLTHTDSNLRDVRWIYLEATARLEGAYRLTEVATGNHLQAAVRLVGVVKVDEAGNQIVGVGTPAADPVLVPRIR